MNWWLMILIVNAALAGFILGVAVYGFCLEWREWRARRELRRLIRRCERR